MRITALVENTVADPRFEAEHGLSLYIETKTHRILFDMGQTELYAQNAKKLGIDLQEADIAVLSHGHYDHGGGLGKFLEINHKADVYVNRYAFEPHYHGKERYIGLDVSLAENDRLRFTGDRTVIDEGLTLYSCNRYERKHDLGSFGLTMLQDNELLPDDFRHEQYLLIVEDNKMVLISGCSHKGIMNITEWFKPDILIGGFHLSKLPLDEKLAEYAKYLNSFDTAFYTCHCTGEEQYTFMKKYMNRLFYLSTGQSINI